MLTCRSLVCTIIVSLLNRLTVKLLSQCISRSSFRLELMSLKILFYQYNDLVALIIDIYSALVVNSETTRCFQDLQLISPPYSKQRNPPVLFWLWASANAALAVVRNTLLACIKLPPYSNARNRVL
jgi:hypothetical protein